MASTKKSSSTKKASTKKASTKKASAAKVHTEVTATFLAFANPPSASDSEQVARDCAAQGLEAIGIHGPFSDGNIIDFGAMTPQDCVDLADSIEACVDEKGFHLPPLAATFDVMRQSGTKITFGNFVKALSKQMTPKG